MLMLFGILLYNEAISFKFLDIKIDFENIFKKKSDKEIINNDFKEL